MNNFSNEAFATRLKDARIQAGFRSQKQFSRKCNIGESTYGNYEAGVRIPNFEVIDLLSKALKVNPAWLCGFEVPREEQSIETSVRIEDNLMLDDLAPGNIAYFDPEKSSPSTFAIYVIEVNNSTLVRWIRPELDGSYTIFCNQNDKSPDKTLTKEEMDQLNILGRVTEVKREI